MRRVSTLLISLFLLTASGLAAQSAESLFQAGRQAFEDRLFQLAGDSLRRLLRDYPEDPRADDAEYLLAASSFYLGDYEACLDVLRNFERRHPRSPYAGRVLYWRGNALFRLGRFEEAAAALERQAADHPQEEYSRRHSLLLRAMALERLARHDEAAAVYRRLLEEPAGSGSEESSGLPEVLFRLGGLELRRGRYAEARLLFSRLLLEYPADSRLDDALFFLGESLYFLDELEEAAKRYTRLLNADEATPYAETILYRLSRIAFRRGDAAEALVRLQALERGFPEGVHRREVPRLKGELLFRLGRFAEAAAAYEKALPLSASPQERQLVHYNLGLSAEQAGDGAGAIGWYGQAGAGADESIREDSHFRRALLLIGAGRAGEAAPELLRYAGLYPGSARREEALLLAAGLQAEAGAAREAADTCTRLLMEHPRSARLDEALFRRGRAWLELGEVPAALQDLSRIVRDFPESSFLPESLYAIGYTYASGNEYARALPYFQRLDALLEQPAGRGLPAERDAPDLAGRNRLALGICLYNLERFPAALEAFEKLAAAPGPAGTESLTPWTGQAWFHRGRTLYRLERLAEAADSFRQAAGLLAGQSDGAEALYWQGNAEFRLGLLAEAGATFRALAEQYPGQPRRAESLYRAGLCEARLERYAESVKLLDEALRAVAAGSPLKAEILYEKGWSLFELGRRREALGVFENLRREFPRNPLAPEAFFRLAEEDYRAAEYRSALAGFQRVRKEYPDLEIGLTALYWAGLSAFHLERRPEALELLWAYLKGRPVDGRGDPALEKIREILAAPGNEALAVRFYRQVEADPDVAPAIRNQVRLEYARAVFPSRPEESFAVLETIRASAPAEPLKGEVDFLLGRCFQARGEVQRALEIFSAIAETRVDRFGASALLQAARLLEETGRREEAAARYLEVGFIYPGFGDLVEESLFRAARVYEALGRSDQAARILARLREEHPDSPWLWESLEP